MTGVCPLFCYLLKAKYKMPGGGGSDSLSGWGILKGLGSSLNVGNMQFWQREVGMLSQQLQKLQENHRQLMGEELSGLSTKDIQNLEKQLETSLNGIRVRKEQLLIHEIQELNWKRNLVRQENVELQEKVKRVREQNVELRNKVYGYGEGQGTGGGAKELFPGGLGDERIYLQLCLQPQPQNHGEEKEAN